MPRTRSSSSLPALRKRIDLPLPPIWHGAVKSIRPLLSSIAVLLAAGCATPPAIAPGNYFVDVEFTVAPDGQTKDAKVIQTNAPKEVQQEAILEVSRYKAEPSAQASRGRRRIEYNIEKEPEPAKQEQR